MAKLTMMMLLIVVLVVACRAGMSGESGSHPGASGAATGSTDATDLGGASPSSSAASSPVPIAIPDAFNDLVHAADEPVSIGDSTVIYRGLEARNGQFVATFDISGAPLNAARLHAASADTADLDGVEGTVESAPFGDMGNPPSRDANLTLIVGDQLVVFRTGKVR